MRKIRICSRSGGSSGSRPLDSFAIRRGVSDGRELGFLYLFQEGGNQNGLSRFVQDALLNLLDTIETDGSDDEVLLSKLFCYYSRARYFSETGLPFRA